ncbi:MAG TPA: Na+/H+ antiporter NhaA [Anaeromyxobacter sp.]|nr:Na+/H+ antiporter NhaA [Anaeromyxobacter sp.]
MGRATRSPLGAKTALPLFAAVVRPIQAFLRLEAASGIVLLSCAVAALVLANSGASEVYRAILGAPVELAAGPLRARFSVAMLVNDGLMTIFFFVVGLEIKRELAVGELRTLPQALLPAIAALGGMVFPAALFLAFNWNGPGRAGWGIPMATDIAFCVGVLTLLRSRVPHALVVFVTALAIFDDIGGILVIALFYGHGLDVVWLAVAAGITASLVLMSRAYVRSGLAYAVAGAFLWYALHHAGIHATIAGIVVGLSVPARPRSHPREVLAELAAHAGQLVRTAADEELDSAAILEVEERLEHLESPLARFVHLLHPWVAFGIMPLFALANSGVDLRALEPAQLTGRLAVGTAVALFFGKQLGIFAFTWVALRVGAAPMPGGASAAKLLGVATVAGIGFTVALFIAGLAYPASPDLLDEAKVGILAGSLVSGIVGAVILRFTRATAASRSGEQGATTRVEGETGVG